jgi:hypothetical protein
VENPTEHLIEICAEFPKLSDGQYTRKKSSVHVWQINHIQRFNRVTWSHEDSIDKEKVLIEDADFSDYDCYVEYDNLYGLNKQLLKTVCDDAKLIAVTAKSLKYVVDELPTFAEYVKGRAESIPDKIVSLRELKKWVRSDYYIKGVDCPLMKLYGQVLDILEKTPLDTHPSPRYTESASDERCKPPKLFIDELNTSILSEYPMLSNVEFNRFCDDVQAQMVEFFNFVAAKNPPEKFTKLIESFKELKLT